MSRFHARFVLCLVVGAIACLALPVSAELTPSWSIDELSAFSSLIVRGHVRSVSAQWDPAVNGLYTYTTVDVSETWKGQLSSTQIVVKTLGGRVGDVELRIDGQ